SLTISSFFLTDPLPTDISTLSLHDALPISDLLDVFRRHDADRPAVARAHPHGQQRERLARDDVDGERIDDIDVVDGRDARTAGRALLGVEHALDAVLHGGRVERLAVVELDPAPQLELPRGLVEEPPRLGEVALQLE